MTKSYYVNLTITKTFTTSGENEDEALTNVYELPFVASADVVKTNWVEEIPSDHEEFGPESNGTGTASQL